MGRRRNRSHALRKLRAWTPSARAPWRSCATPMRPASAAPWAQHRSAAQRAAARRRCGVGGLQDGRGRPLPIYTMRGARDHQLAGRHGERYRAGLQQPQPASLPWRSLPRWTAWMRSPARPAACTAPAICCVPARPCRIEGFRKSQRGSGGPFVLLSKERAYAGNTPGWRRAQRGRDRAALFEVRLQGRDAAQPAPEPWQRPSLRLSRRRQICPAAAVLALGL